MATFDISQLITESMMTLQTEGADISRADDYNPKNNRPIVSGTSDYSKGAVPKSQDHIIYVALQAGNSARAKARAKATKSYDYDTKPVLK